MLSKANTNYFQLGRTILEISIKDPTKLCSVKNICCRSRSKVAKGNLAFDGEDFFPEEFLIKNNEFTREEEALGNN